MPSASAVIIILHVELLLHFLRVSRITLRGELLSFALIFCMTCIFTCLSLLTLEATLLIHRKGATRL